MNSERIERLERRVTLFAFVALAALVSAVSVGVGMRMGLLLPPQKESSSFQQNQKPVRASPSPANTTLQLRPQDPDISTEAVEDLRSASAVAIAHWKVRDGMSHSVIQELLWVDPEVTFGYQVGDEFGHPTKMLENEVLTDGLIAYFKGNPATIAGGKTFRAGRIAAYDDMRLDRFRKLIEEKVEAGTGQPATRSQSKSEGSDKPKSEAEGRSR